MTAGPAPARTGRILFAATVVSALSVTGVLGALRANVAGTLTSPPSLPPAILRGVAIALLAGATVVLRLVRATLPPGGRDLDAWWKGNVGKAVAIWALMDGAAIMGAVAFLLSGDVLVLVLAVGWAVAMFMRHAPGRLTDG